MSVSEDVAASEQTLGEPLEWYGADGGRISTREAGGLIMLVTNTGTIPVTLFAASDNPVSLDPGSVWVRP